MSEHFAGIGMLARDAVNRRRILQSSGLGKHAAAENDADRAWTRSRYAKSDVSGGQSKFGWSCGFGPYAVFAETIQSTRKRTRHLHRAFKVNQASRPLMCTAHELLDRSCLNHCSSFQLSCKFSSPP